MQLSTLCHEEFALKMGFDYRRNDRYRIPQPIIEVLSETATLRRVLFADNQSDIVSMVEIKSSNHGVSRGQCDGGEWVE